MKEQNVENTQHIEEENFAQKFLAFFEKNQKTLYIIAGVIVVAVIAFFAISKLYIQPRNIEASEEMFAAEQWFSNNDFELALTGNDDHLGFLDIIDEYGCTKAGNLAKYYAGICELQTGKFNEAIAHLKAYKGKDTFTKVETIMMLGDAEAELGNDAEAVKYYEKAAKTEDNFITTPAALFKAGIIYLTKLNNRESALRCFNTIKTNYPEATERNDIDKYIAFAEASK